MSAQREPLDRPAKHSRPEGSTEMAASRVCRPFRADRCCLTDPGAACSLRFALAPGYPLAAPSALRVPFTTLSPLLRRATRSLHYPLAAPSALYAFPSLPSRRSFGATRSLRYPLAAPSALYASLHYPSPRLRRSVVTLHHGTIIHRKTSLTFPPRDEIVRPARLAFLHEPQGC